MDCHRVVLCVRACVRLSWGVGGPDARGPVRQPHPFGHDERSEAALHHTEVVAGGGLQHGPVNYWVRCGWVGACVWFFLLCFKRFLTVAYLRLTTPLSCNASL